MATRATAAQRQLIELERDLRDYATMKTHKVMEDVVQSFQIAGLSNDHAAACLGSLFMRLAATLAVDGSEKPMSKVKFMRYAEELYDGAIAVKDSEEHKQ